MDVLSFRGHGLVPERLGTMMWRVWIEDSAYVTCVAQAQQERCEKIIYAMAQYKDPRSYMDGNGGYVKPLVGDLVGRYSYKPGHTERYAFQHGNYRIEFELWCDEEQVLHRDLIPANPQQQVMKVISAGSRAAAYTR